MTCDAQPETLTELLGLIKGGVKHNSSETAKDGWKCSASRLLDVMDSSQCSNTDIDRYLRMPKNPSLVDTKVEMPHKLCKEEDAMVEPISPTKDNQLQH